MSRRALAAVALVLTTASIALLSLERSPRLHDAARTARGQAAMDVRKGGLTVVDARTAYDVKPLLDRKADGHGLTIAVMGYERFQDADVAAFRKHYGLDGPTPKHIPVAGGIKDKKQLADHGEVSLDVELISAIAPKAQILSYEAPKDPDDYAQNFRASEMMLKAVVAGPADVVSYSWGMCDLSPAKQNSLSAMSRDDAEFVKKWRDHRAAVEKILAGAVQQGVTFYVASGDSGAYHCQGSDFAYHELSVSWPADSPHVVSVGGTLLSVRRDGSYLAEAGWEQPLGNLGGGGGIGSLGTVPKWQIAHGIARIARALPDVSAAGSPHSGWNVFSDDPSCPHLPKSCWYSQSGTSAAAPFWAASMLIAQQFADRGRAARHCFMAPVLYELNYGKSRYRAFHDVTVGGNRGYPAKAGWDYATGLGSPDLWNLARDLGPLLAASPQFCTQRV